MKKDNDDKFDDIFNSNNENPEEFESPCEVFDAVMSVSLMSKPFGFIWSDDKVITFLKKRGYKILDRKGEDGIIYKVAVKKDSPSIPETSNLLSTFEDEVQEILINWLLKISE